MSYEHPQKPVSLLPDYAKLYGNGVNETLAPEPQWQAPQPMQPQQVKPMFSNQMIQ